MLFFDMLEGNTREKDFIQQILDNTNLGLHRNLKTPSITVYHTKKCRPDLKSTHGFDLAQFPADAGST